MRRSEQSRISGIKTSHGSGCWLSISKINWPPCNMKYSQERCWLPHLIAILHSYSKVSTICTWRVEVEVYRVRLVVVAGSQPQPAAACRTCFQLARRERRDSPPARQPAPEETVSQSALQYFQTWHWRNFLWRDEWTVVSIFKPDTSSPALCV